MWIARIEDILELRQVNTRANAYRSLLEARAVGGDLRLHEHQTRYSFQVLCLSVTHAATKLPVEVRVGLHALLTDHGPEMVREQYGEDHAASETGQYK